MTVVSAGLVQENIELRRRTEEAQERSTAAERRQQADRHKQARFHSCMCHIDQHLDFLMLSLTS